MTKRLTTSHDGRRTSFAVSVPAVGVLVAFIFLPFSLGLHPRFDSGKHCDVINAVHTSGIINIGRYRNGSSLNCTFTIAVPTDTGNDTRIKLEFSTELFCVSRDSYQCGLTGGRTCSTACDHVRLSNYEIEDKLITTFSQLDCCFHNSSIASEKCLWCAVPLTVVSRSNWISFHVHLISNYSMYQAVRWTLINQTTRILHQAQKNCTTLSVLNVTHKNDGKLSLKDFNNSEANRNVSCLHHTLKMISTTGTRLQLNVNLSLRYENDSHIRLDKTDRFNLRKCIQFQNHDTISYMLNKTNMICRTCTGVICDYLRHDQTYPIKLLVTSKSNWISIDRYSSEIFSVSARWKLLQAPTASEVMDKSLTTIITKVILPTTEGTEAPKTKSEDFDYSLIGTFISFIILFAFIGIFIYCKSKTQRDRPNGQDVNVEASEDANPNPGPPPHSETLAPALNDPPPPYIKDSPVQPPPPTYSSACLRMLDTAGENGFQNSPPNRNQRESETQDQNNSYVQVRTRATTSSERDPLNRRPPPPTYSSACLHSLEVNAQINTRSGSSNTQSSRTVDENGRCEVCGMQTQSINSNTTDSSNFVLPNS